MNYRRSRKGSSVAYDCVHYESATFYVLYMAQLSYRHGEPVTPLFGDILTTRRPKTRLLVQFSLSESREKNHTQPKVS